MDDADLDKAVELAHFALFIGTVLLRCYQAYGSGGHHDKFVGKRQPELTEERSATLFEAGVEQGPQVTRKTVPQGPSVIKSGVAEGGCSGAGGQVGETRYSSNLQFSAT